MQASSPPAQHNRRPVLEWRLLSSLISHPRDPRTYKRADKKRVIAAVRRFGPPPMVVTSEGVLLSGNIWLTAAIEAGYEEAPVMVADHLSQAEADAYLLANVKLVELGAWDQRRLGEILMDLSLGELAMDIDITGFETAEIDAAIGSLSVGDDDGPDPDDAPAPDGPAVCRPGDLWRLGRHRLLCANAMDGDSYVRLFAQERAALVISDPPYNVPIHGNVSRLADKGGRARHREFACASGEMSEAEFTAFLTTVCGRMAQASEVNSLHYLFMNWRGVFPLVAAGRAVYDDLINLCVWTKPGGGMGGLYRSSHEMVLVFKHGRGAHRNNVQLGKFGRNRSNVWSYEGSAGLRQSEDADLIGEHPTPKPVRMIADAILDASARGEWVLDPFLGSGTTLIACERVGRRCAGMEIDPLYVDLAIRRWRRLTGEDAIREADGKSFSELMALAEDAA